MDESIKEFIIECNENLNQLDSCLIELERNESDPQVLERTLRTIHTIKGSSGFLAFSKLETITHEGENLLSLLRDGKLRFSTSVVSALLVMVDAIRQLLSKIETTGEEGKQDYSALIARLKKESNLAVALEEDPKGFTEIKSKPLGELLVDAGLVTPRQISEALAAQEAGDSRHLGEILVERGNVSSADVLEVLKTQKDVRGQTVSESNIRVDVSLLDKLMDLVGELVLTRNQILQFTPEKENTDLSVSSQRLNIITTELQEGVMKTHLQPINKVWSRFPRLVRDLALACGKSVSIEMKGKDTELDKTLIEAIKDPLMHLVRNCIDHGIEKPEVRKKHGKPPEGRLILRAFHEGGWVNIEIADDGAGIDLEKIRKKAIEKNLMTPSQAANKTERELLNFIFLPGFSTAEKVTNISGRGVGMDVVRQNIEAIGGTVDIRSIAGQGMTAHIKIPLTLAIIPALIVTSQGESYAIPQVSLLELVRLQESQKDNLIEMVYGAPVYRLRGNLIPLVYLNRVLDLGAPNELAPPGLGSANIVVLQADKQTFGLIVDKVHDTQEIVVKPLGKQLKNLAVFAGATIRGDGTVMLILDVLGIAQYASVVSSEIQNRLTQERQGETKSEDLKLQQLLLFQNRDRGRMAIALSAAVRLERFPFSAIERVGDRDVVQYRGKILHLADVLQLVQERRQKPRHSEELGSGDGQDKESKTLPTIVCADGEHQMGLVVAKVVDIVTESVLEKNTDSCRDGVIYSTVIQGHVTEILDVGRLIQKAAMVRPETSPEGEKLA